MKTPEELYAGIADEGLRAYMIEGARFYPADAVNFTMAEQRAFYDRYCAHFRKPRPAGLKVTDFSADGVPCRFYLPEADERPPLLIYYHGGGYVLGGLDSHDDVCAEIAAGAGVAVIGVHYRLAPEHRFPAAHEDAVTVMRYAALHAADFGADAARMIVGGDSAGGNLAAGAAIFARDHGGPALRGQVLIYPGLGGDMSKGSYVELADAPGLTTQDVIFYRDSYLGQGVTQEQAGKFACPLLETDYEGLPPAFIIGAGLDPLRDDAREFTARLRASGGEARLREEPLLVHGYLRARHMSTPARESFAAIIAAVRALAYDGRLS
jgi:acetyl esterase